MLGFILLGTSIMKGRVVREVHQNNWCQMYAAMENFATTGILRIIRHQWEPGNEFTNKLRSKTVRLSSLKDPREGGGSRYPFPYVFSLL